MHGRRTGKDAEGKAPSMKDCTGVAIHSLRDTMAAMVSLVDYLCMRAAEPCSPTVFNSAVAALDLIEVQWRPEDGQDEQVSARPDGQEGLGS